MGLLITYKDISSNEVVYTRYVKLERFEFVKETVDFTRIQFRMNPYLSRDSGDIYTVDIPDLSGYFPYVYSIYTDYPSMNSIPLVPYIYYYFKEQLKVLGFQVEDVLEENQEAYLPPSPLQFPTSIQPNHSAYRYYYSSITYYLSPTQPIPFL